MSLTYFRECGFHIFIAEAGRLTPSTNCLTNSPDELKIITTGMDGNFAEKTSSLAVVHT